MNCGADYEAISPTIIHNPKFSIEDLNAGYILRDGGDDFLCFPERAIKFDSVGTILVEQSLADVGYTLWDSEIIVMRYLDSMLNVEIGSSIAELGAGCGAAGILCAKKKASNVVLQEIDKVIDFTKRVVKHNLGSSSSSYKCVSGRWSHALADDMIAANGGKAFDLVVMSDVFYHGEDFDALIECTAALCHERSCIVLSYEQRKMDVSIFVTQLLETLRFVKGHKASVTTRLQTKITMSDDVEDKDPSLILNGADRLWMRSTEILRNNSDVNLKATDFEIVTIRCGELQ
jgi:predicted nicotinamide N-methyase